MASWEVVILLGVGIFNATAPTVPGDVPRPANRAGYGYHAGTVTEKKLCSVACPSVPCVLDSNMQCREREYDVNIRVGSRLGVETLEPFRNFESDLWPLPGCGTALPVVPILGYW
ncbi:hypothetical protein B0H16DRAFT_1466823 [Mycena metata]|uniref:Uncharacterized protein n=1 Tax=Mycena metata TaxID=1033252 RepID=A0AAD7I6F8_9AGAR|nr:hypothetical protein B0H16DRAFT_1466823 [Mycena metata]